MLKRDICIYTYIIDIFYIHIYIYIYILPFKLGSRVCYSLTLLFACKIQTLEFLFNCKSISLKKTTKFDIKLECKIHSTRVNKKKKLW